MESTDLSICSRIRQVLASYWIDLRLIQFGSFRGVVRFSGRMCSISSSRRLEVSANVIQTIESEVRKIRGVRGVFFDLSNFDKDADGIWNPSVMS